MRSQIVFDIWHRFFRFPPPVATQLTKLTTKDGLVPQGAKTSALLSNLVFLDEERRLVGDLLNAESRTPFSVALALGQSFEMTF